MTRMIEELITQNRSCRRFRPASVDVDMLKYLVNLARLSASAANRQPLKYIISNRRDTNDLIFPCLTWAGYLKDGGPSADERPSAYIVILGDRDVSGEFGCDHGIAAQSIALGAREKGLSSCMIGAIDRTRLASALGLQENYEILLVVALGAPGENAVVEELLPGGSIKYWRDAEGVHHVPKRRLSDVIICSYEKK